MTYRFALPPALLEMNLSAPYGLAGRRAGWRLASLLFASGA